jgi:hypothetical protein
VVTIRLPFDSYGPRMPNSRNDHPQANLTSLEAAAASARGGFACMFSSSDEYETALITERRAQGRYTSSSSIWPKVVFAGCVVVVVGSVLFLA